MTQMAPKMLAGIRAYAAAPLFRWSAPEHLFVVLTTPRTGSQLLVELLDSHPAIRCDSEILEKPPRAPGLYLRSRAAQSGAGAHAYGFKLMTHHVVWQPQAYSSLGGFIAQLQKAGFQLVVLRRRHQLDQALSLLAANQVGFHPRRGDRVAVDRLPVDAASLIHVLVLLEQQVLALEQTVRDLPHLAVTYEEDLLDPAGQQATVDRLCDWLGVARAPVTSNLVRPAPDGLVGRVADPAGMAAALRTTRFAPLAAQLDQPRRSPL